MPKLKGATFTTTPCVLLRLAEMNAVWIPSWDDHDDKLGLQGSPGFQLSSSRSAQEDCEAKPELEAQRRDLRKLLLRLRTWNDLNKRIGDGREGRTNCPCLQGIFSADRTFCARFKFKMKQELFPRVRVDLGSMS